MSVQQEILDSKCKRIIIIDEIDSLVKNETESEKRLFIQGIVHSSQEKVSIVGIANSAEFSFWVEKIVQRSLLFEPYK